MSGDNISRCGRPGHDSSRCRVADYPSCGEAGSADLSQLISYNSHGLSFAEPGLDKRKFKQPTLKQIREIDWSRFPGVAKICRQGNAWFAAVNREPAPMPEPDLSFEPAAEEEAKGFFDEVFDPIAEAFDLLMEGRAERALDTLGWERAAGLAAAGIAGIAIVVSLIRLPIKSARKKRVAQERAEARRLEQAQEQRRQNELDLARQQATDAHQRAAQAEAAVHEAVKYARELAATRERSPTPQPLDLIKREDTPIPLVVESQKIYPEGREYDKTDPNLIPMVSTNVEFNVIDAVLAAKGRPMLELEKEFGLRIRIAEIKRAAILAQAFPVEGRTLVEATVDYLGTALVFERGKEMLSEQALLRAAVHLSQERVSAEAARGALAPHRAWFENTKIETTPYEDYKRFIEERKTLVPAGAENVKPEPPTRRADFVKLEPETRRVPPAEAEGRPAERLRAAPAASATVSVQPEALAVDRARRQQVFLSGGGDLFSPEELRQIGEGLEFRKEGGIPTDSSPRHDPARVMSAAAAGLAGEGSPYAGLPNAERARIAEYFADAVTQVPDFGREHFRDRRPSQSGLHAVADMVRFIEADESLRTLAATEKQSMVRQYARAFACNRDFADMHKRGGVSLDMIMRAGQTASSPPVGRAPGRSGKERSGRSEKAKKDRRSDSFRDPFASDSFQGLLRDVAKKRGGK